jgi:Flp pilus assembly pilin Flp
MNGQFWPHGVRVRLFAGNCSMQLGFVVSNSEAAFKQVGKMKKLLLRLWREEEGQDLVEYALLLVLISLIAIASITTVGKAVSNAFSNTAANLTAT